MCGGGNDPAEDLSNELANIFRSRERFVGPFLQSRIQGGLPFREQLLDFQGGQLARQFAPVRAAQARRFANFGSLPSGFREQSEVDLGAAQGRAFDDQVTRALLLDEEARMRAAGMSNPLGFAQSALQGFLS